VAGPVAAAPAGAAVSSVASAEVDPGRVVVPGLTTASSTTFREPDGSMTLDAAPAPVNFRGAAGEWREIDAGLVGSRGGAWAVENRAAAFRLRLPQGAEETPLRLSRDGVWVEMSMAGMSGPPDVSGATATYEAAGAADCGAAIVEGALTTAGAFGAGRALGAIARPLATTAARACSFDGETLVLMADGTKKAISEIQAGDKVIATDPETGEQKSKTVRSSPPPKITPSGQSPTDASNAPTNSPRARR
jgi:hypothetical protein